MKKIVFFILFLGFLRADEELWLLEQDIVKFGKKESYEGLKKSFNEAGSLFLALQDEEANQYFYLYPLVGTDFEALFQKKEIEGPIFHAKKKMLDSTLHFKQYLMLRYLPQASYIPLHQNGSIFSHPCVHYYVFSVVLGEERAFEERLESVAKMQAGMMAADCFRVWKVLIGSDVPKYLVALFARTKEELKSELAKIVFIQPSQTGLLRHEREGEVILRQDLSTLHASSNNEGS